MNLPTTQNQTPQQRTAAAIGAVATRAAADLKRAYEQLRRLTGYTPSGLNPDGLTVDECWAAVEAQRPANIDSVELARLAQATKAMVNLFVKVTDANGTPVPTINDAVPEATITFPA